MKILRQIILLVTVFTVSFHGLSYAWMDKTHIAIGQAAGFDSYYDLAAPDVAKIRASEEGPNHYFDNEANGVVTVNAIKKQIEDTDHSHGHLYGAIIENLRKYIELKRAGKFADYYMVYVGHYIGDLSMPLHNINQTPWGWKHHLQIDGTLEKDIDYKRIKVDMYSLKTEDDVMAKIAEIANASIQVADRIQGNENVLTEDEVYDRIGKSASLFRAVLEYADRQSQI